MVSKKIVFVLMLAVGLIGCAVTSEQLRTNPNETGSFHVDEPFDVVRTNLISVFKSCFKLNIGAGHSFPEIHDTIPNQALKIEGILDNVSRVVLISIDATRNPNGGTDITYYKGRLAVFASYRETVENWVNGRDKGC
jgi:hypothetical protein